jgi:hypothetical protein
MKLRALSVAALFGLLLLSGCVELPTSEQCENINDQDVLDGAGWGEVLATDESYVLQSKIGCWHSVALADAARNDPQAAAESCTKILSLKDDYPEDLDTLNSEFNTCVDAAAKRLRDTSVCDNIDEEAFAFQYERCVAHATPPPPMCSSALILLAAVPALLISRRGK